MTMHDKSKFRRWFALVLVLFLSVAALAGCGGSAEEEAEPWRLSQAMLPRVTVSIDEQGAPSLLGISLGRVASLLGQDFSGMYLPADLVATMTEKNIQHAEVVLLGDGIFLYVNGQPLPYLAMDEDTRQAVGGLIDKYQVANGNILKGFLTNIVPRIGLPVALKFPLQAGVAEIPMRDSGVLAQVSVEDARAEAGDRSIIAYLDVQFDGAGTPVIAGHSLQEFQVALAEAGIAADLSAARLDPALVASLLEADIQHVQIETEPEGLHLYLNGQRLPFLAWDQERLQNALALYGSLDEASPYLPLLQFLEPYLQPSDLELTLFFPPQAGSEQPDLQPFIRVR